MAADNDERRVPAARYDITLFIGQGDEGIPLGHTRNLSLSGIFLETDARPPVDSVQEISLVWGEQTYVCRARIVRHADDGIGLTFLDPDQGFCWALDEIIADQ